MLNRLVRKFYFSTRIFCLYFSTLFFVSSVFAQIRVTGKLVSEIKNKPIMNATVIVLEEKKKKRTKNGSFTFQLPSEDSYTFIVNAVGFSKFEKKIFVKNNKKIIIRLSTVSVRGYSIIVQEDRNIQKLSRNTLKRKELKNVPATFGDSLSALTTLPGILSTTSLFGNLIIRGAKETNNRYYIDSIPVLYPQHFGALQSIISNELVNLIDLYSSNFPASYGDALGAIIETKTVDEIKEFNGLSTIAIISADAYLGDKISINSDKQQGYWIASGRVSYLTSIVGPLLRAIDGDSNFQLPQYYDYQLKGKLFLDEKGKHSLKVLFFGFYDTLKFLRENVSDEKKEELIDDGTDPLFIDFQFKNTVFSNNLGFYYKTKFSNKLNNELIFFTTLTDSRFLADLPSAQSLNFDSIKTDVNIKPYIFGLKEKFLWQWLDFASLEAGIDWQTFSFTSKGEVQALTRNVVNQGGPPDLGDSTLFQATNADFEQLNHTLDFYLENILFWGKNLKFVPGLRFSFLTLTEEVRVDPKFLLSYDFFWDMNISGAISWYSSFPQTNYFLFNQVFNQQPQIAQADYVRAERARHISIGIKQSLFFLIAKLEGFYNNFTNSLVNSVDQSTNRLFANTGFTRSYGLEFLLKLNLKPKSSRKLNYYGWISYTYSDSKSRSGLSLDVDTYGNRLLSSSFEQPHSLKLIAGVSFKTDSFGVNNIGFRFELGSGFPYTPIIGSKLSNLASRVERYSPTYGTPYSERYPINHRLDIRYTNTGLYKWGTLSWYIEIINVYFYRPLNQQQWNYNRPYEENSNPSFDVSPTAFIIPNFGVEFKF